MKRILLAAALALALSPVLTHSASAAPSPPPWLVTLSRNVAERNGDELPLWGTYVETTRGAALHVVRSNDMSAQPVYEVVLGGQFTEPLPYTLQRPVPPTGTVNMLVVSVSSHRILQYRLSSRVPDSARLGVVRALPFNTTRLRPPSIAPRQLVARYFADLNAHHPNAAYLLEATCQADFTLPNGPGAPIGAGDLAARSAMSGVRHSSHGPNSHAPPILRAARVTSIRPFHDSILTRNHFLGFEVGVWLRLVYPPVGPGYAGNNERPSGYHVVKMILHRCDGRWGVDPGWMGSGGPWTWR